MESNSKESNSNKSIESKDQQEAEKKRAYKRAYYKKRTTEGTPEEREAFKSRVLEYRNRYLEKIRAKQRAEEELAKQALEKGLEIKKPKDQQAVEKQKEYIRRYNEKLKRLTPEELKPIKSRRAENLRKYRAKQKELKKQALEKGLEIKKDQQAVEKQRAYKRAYYKKRTTEGTPEEREAFRSRFIEHRKRFREKIRAKQKAEKELQPIEKRLKINKPKDPQAVEKERAYKRAYYKKRRYEGTPEEREAYIRRLSEFQKRALEKRRAKLGKQTLNEGIKIKKPKDQEALEKREKKNAYRRAYYKKQKTRLTPEEAEALRSRHAEIQRIYQEKIRAKRKAGKELVENDALKRKQTLKKNREYQRTYYIKKTTEGTPEEQKAFRSRLSEYRKRAIEKRRAKRKELRKQTLEKGLEIKKTKLQQAVEKQRAYKRAYYKKRRYEDTPEEREAFIRRLSEFQKRALEKRKAIRRELGKQTLDKGLKIRKPKDQEALEKKISTLSLSKDESDVRLKEEVHEIKNEECDDSLSSWLTNEQTTIGFSCKNEIEIESEVFQQTVVSAIPKTKSKSPWNSFKLPSKKENCSQSNLMNASSLSQSKHFNQIERRKTDIICIREATEKIVRKDEFDIFGKYICEQLRSSTIGISQMEIAKLLIDQILHNLAVGTYELT